MMLAARNPTVGGPVVETSLHIENQCESERQNTCLPAGTHVCADSIPGAQFRPKFVGITLKPQMNTGDGMRRKFTPTQQLCLDCGPWRASDLENERQAGDEVGERRKKSASTHFEEDNSTAAMRKTVQSGENSYQEMDGNHMEMWITGRKRGGSRGGMSSRVCGAAAAGKSEFEDEGGPATGVCTWGTKMFGVVDIDARERAERRRITARGKRGVLFGACLPRKRSNVGISASCAALK
ncbi:hypothetical protein K438DRAFT_1784958 [Mycena galopus ATCC 62051]|nr:hypothetical protein K438DRAFT_1784958 [Mycena galopus ATCC 62051]